jgi:Fur family zinc uptake transcriptional regulator
MKPRQLNDNDRSVLGALGDSSRPLSAYDILDRARSDALKAPVQVYRALEKLEGRGLVHRIEALNAFVACSEHDEACREAEHRHPRHRPGFVICRDCGTVREFEDERVSEIAEEAAGTDFAIDLVSLEVYGHCAACQTGP